MADDVMRASGRVQAQISSVGVYIRADKALARAQRVICVDLLEDVDGSSSVYKM